MAVRWMAMVAIVLASSLGLGAQGGRGFQQGPPPDVSGKWSGTWSSYNPAQGATPPKEQCKTLSAVIEKSGDDYKALFEGDCGQPYKYSITMDGRLVGNAVMFKGTADLGPKDGGVFDWIGRADGKQFVGFYTSAYATGVFSLARTPN